MFRALDNMTGGRQEKVDPVQYRLVLDDFDGEPYGVIKIDNRKSDTGSHLIRDKDGDLRREYRYRIIDQSDYDNAIAFKLYKVINVEYRRTLRLFGHQAEWLWIIPVIALIILLLGGLVFPNIIQWNDVAPTVRDSGWFQTFYWSTHIGFPIGLIVFGISSLANEFTDRATKKDKHIATWKNFLSASKSDSEDEGG